MTKPITITATVAAWVSKDNMRNLADRQDRGDDVAAVTTPLFYGSPDKTTFCDYLRIGVADITLRLIPKDDQARVIVQALQQQLADDGAKWHARQEAIRSEISKWQALTFDGTVSES